MKKWKSKLDSACAVAMALTAVITLCSCKTNKETETVLNVIPEHTTLPTTAETTEAITEPTETEPPVTVATEPTETTESKPPVALYDVPISEELQIYMIELAEVNGIDPAILFAIAQRESNYRADAVGDSGGSVGLMQVQPYWHSERMERLGCTNLLDPFQNVTVAVDYLVEMLTWYSTIDKALVAYNSGSYNGTITEYAYSVMNIAEEVRQSRYLGVD